MQAHLLRPQRFLFFEEQPFEAGSYVAAKPHGTDTGAWAQFCLGLTNCIRHRLVDDPSGGPQRRESNARLLRWSDGTVSLMIGDEMIDLNVSSMPSARTYLCSQQGTMYLLQLPCTSKMAPITQPPASAILHEMARHLVGTSSKPFRTRQTQIQTNVEEEYRRGVKHELERQRAAERRNARQQRVRERSNSGAISESFLEERTLAVGQTGMDVDASSDSVAAAGQSDTDMAPRQAAHRADSERANDGRKSPDAARIKRPRRILRDEDDEDEEGGDKESYRRK